jgi:DNA topoisomerase-3
VHEYKATVALMRIAGEQFKSTGRMVTVKGWKVLYESSGDDDDAKTPALPVLQTGEKVRVDSSSLLTKRTEPPQLLDGASLLDAMKNAHRYVTDPAVKSRLKDVEGLGTEATRAATIEGLVKHKYMVEVPKKGTKNKGKDYATTAQGRALLQLVSAELSKPDLTAWCEGKLEEIVEGAMPFERFSAIAEKLTKKIVDELKAPEAQSRVPKVESDNTQKCSDCGGTLTVRSTKDKKEKFWGCRAYPVCKHTEPYVEPTKSRKASGPASFKGKPRSVSCSTAQPPDQDFPI